MDLNAAIARINAAPISQDQKNAVIAQLVLASFAAPATADPAVAAAAAHAAAEANLNALRHTVPGAVAGTGGVGARQSDAVLAAALSYQPTAPTDADKLNPTGWAYKQFVAAGLTEVSAPNGPLERWGPAMNYYHMSWEDAVKFVIHTYAAGTANIESRDDPAANAQAWQDAQARMKVQNPNPVTAAPVAPVDQTVIEEA